MFTYTTFIYALLHCIAFDLKQVVTISPETGVGFAESSLSASISETAVPGQLVATIPLEPLESGNLAGGSSRRRIRIDCKLDEVVDTKSNHVKGELGQKQFWKS